MRTHGYCLYCFHQELDEHFRCLECGRFSLPAERAEYWNRHPKLIHMEQAWKSVVLFLAIAGTFATCSTMSVTAGPGSGWIILLPAAFSVGAWKTTEKYTRHLPYFDARIVWCAALVICGTVFGLLAISSGGGSRESLVWAAGFFGVGLAFAVVVSQICLRYENWKHAVMRGERRP